MDELDITVLEVSIDNLHDSFDDLVGVFNENLKEFKNNDTILSLKRMIDDTYYSLTGCECAIDDFEDNKYYDELSQLIGEFDSKLFNLQLHKLDDVSIKELVKLPNDIKSYIDNIIKIYKKFDKEVKKIKK